MCATHVVVERTLRSDESLEVTQKLALPPGNIVLWRGLTRLTDIHFGFELSNRVVGN